MEYQWEYSSGTYFDSVLLGVQFYITGNILMVFITIHLLGSSIAYHWEYSSGTNFHSILMGTNGKSLGKFKYYFFSIYT